MKPGKAIELLCAIADERTRTMDEVNALETAVRRLAAKFFQRERNWVRRRAKRLEASDGEEAK